jgi:glutamyl-tRNA synthetase
LFNWLFARHAGGKFILRIEDTDAARNTPEAYAAIYDGLRWLGIEWDEGPDVAGDFGPYQQSERKEIYDRHLAKLEASGAVYDDGGAIRFRSPRKPVVVRDLICGDCEFNRDEPDMTIRRPDGSYIFHFVNVVDDIEMAITHVIRGEDHLTNTAKHLELFAALGAAPPRYAHMPLSLNPNGSKMSKRDIGGRITDYIEMGFVPSAVRNYLFLQGWSLKDDREKLDLAEVIEKYEITDMTSSNAKFDLEKCKWLSGQYLQEMPANEIVAGCIPFLEKAGIAGAGEHSQIERLCDLIRTKIRLFSESPEWLRYFFDAGFEYDSDPVEKFFTNGDGADVLRDMRARLDAVDPWNAEALGEVFKVTSKERGVKMGAVMMPFRVAIAGTTSGIGVHDTLEILGKDETLSRLDRAIAELG